MHNATTFYFGCLTIRVFNNTDDQVTKTITLWDDVKVNTQTYNSLENITIDEAVDEAVMVATTSASSAFDVSFQQV